MPTTPREIVTLAIVTVLLCGGLVWIAGQFPKVSRSYVQESAPTTVAAQQPPTATTTAPTAQQLRLAPLGVLYPIEYVSSTTKDGVIGFLPGTPLRVVEDKGDTIVVSDGKKKGEVSADKLTNDLDFMAQQNAAFDRDERQIEAKQAANYVPWGSSLDRGPWHERGSLSVREWIYNPEYPESRSPPSNVVYADGSGRPYWIDSYGHWRYDRK